MNDQSVNDQLRDNRFDHDLRAMLNESAPAVVPASLRDFVADVPRTAPAGGHSRSRSRRWPMLLAMAAVVIVAVVAAVGVFTGLGKLSGVGTDPTPAHIRLTYQLLPLNGQAPTEADARKVADVMMARLVPPFPEAQVGASGTTVHVDVTVDAASQRLVPGVEQTLGITGKLDFVPLGRNEALGGDTIDMVKNPPLFSNDGIKSVKAGTGQDGGSTLIFTFTPDATAAFATYTSAHVGEWFAVVMDGKAIVVPLINEAIPNGEVEIGAGMGWSEALATSPLINIILSGPLPFPVQQTSADIPSFAPAPAVDPTPTVVPTPPSATAHWTYEVLDAHGYKPTQDDVNVVAGVMRARMEAYTFPEYSVSVNGMAINVSITSDALTDAIVTGVRRTLVATGQIDIVPLGSNGASQGETIDMIANPPLFSNDGIKGARVAADQTGRRIVELTLTPAATTTFADYTAAHVGDFVAIAMDGRAISVPVINEAIPDGVVQISQGGPDGWPEAEATALVNILQSGALPFPVREDTVDIPSLAPAASAVP